MSQSAIEVRDLVKHYQILERDAGLKGAIKALFSRKYRTKEAVKGIDLSIAPGERVGYIGFNGAGKSTTIKMLAGVLRPDTGSVRIFGIDPHEDRIQNARQIGAVFGQRTQLFWDIPVRESFDLLREIYEVPRAEFEETVAWFIARLQLEPLLDVPVRQLSLGQKMRCELAAAFLHRPRVVYLDEPTIGLDIDIKETIRAFIREISDAWGTTVILTTHDMQDIEEVCDRVIVLDEGRIIYDDRIETLKQTFNNERTLEITLDDETSFTVPPSVTGFVTELTSDRETDTIQLAFNHHEISSGQLIREIVNCNQVKDLSVVVPKMETLIRNLYQPEVSA
ncbi:ABC transporter related [Exiguobacterium sp. 8H]|uniref:ABC transporter ATP-binding protein n=1 Tax=unclassified Exiguobacterium TaxID=2644629 RepID=UPI0012F1D8F3|nr:MULTISPECIES: ATP-binding cassette domain-containing protein [unclassified Exiguobacterium]VXB94832.1 ABC transporter related [Exiguobacterium sp. 8H]VXC15052.1 ABC transporter related [Exiguobacterium sp. 8A]